MAQDSHNDISKDFKPIGSPLPNFLLKTENGELYANKDFRKEKYLLLMMFNPMCGHCEVATDTLESHLKEWKKTKLLLLVYPNHEGEMPVFNSNHHTADYQKMLVGADSFHVTDRLFLYQGLPQLNIYDKERKLIKIFHGDIFADSVAAYLH
jgi:thioredoxin-related protein